MFGVVKMENVYHNYACILFFQLNFVRFFLPVFLPDAEKVIYLDDDVIVQGEVHSFIVCIFYELQNSH